MTRATTSMDRWDLVFGGFRSSISRAAISPCRIRKNPFGWFSTVKSITSMSSGANWKGYGHVFRTNSDTEVIIHGYKQWGDEVLNRLNGMFGLAIWDVRKKRLVLARDPFGIKLIYYRIDRRPPVFRLGNARRPCDDAGNGGNRPDVAQSLSCAIATLLRLIRS